MEGRKSTKQRDYCLCYEQLTRSTASCCTFCLNGEEEGNDLEELEYMAYMK